MAQVVIAEQAVVVAKQQAQASREQVDFARQQTDTSRDLVELAVQQLEYAERVRREQARPVVFADLRPAADQPELLVLVVRNEGPALARNVRVSLDPPLKFDPTQEPLTEWRFSALPPGTEMTRPLTSGRIFYNEGIERSRQRVTVEGEDLYGPLEVLSYDLDLAALGAVASYGKTLHHVAKALEKIAKNTEPSTQAAWEIQQQSTATDEAEQDFDQPERRA
jgi:hypothetical protein